MDDWRNEKDKGDKTGARIGEIAAYARQLHGEAMRPGFLTELGRRFVFLWALIARIPLPQRWWPEKGDLPRGADALTMMPLAGGALGLISVLPAWLLSFVIPPAPCAWIACGLYTVAGWSLHLDGWGDLWDGVGSGKRGEGMRAVMKDSRSGSFGVAGIVLAIAIRASLLSAIAPDSWPAVCAVAGGVGRFASPSAARWGEYPWESGMARDFVLGFDGCRLFFAFAAACLLLPLAPLGGAMGILLSGGAGAAMGLWANRAMGGAGGDVLGAAAVLGEILVLICCLL